MVTRKRSREDDRNLKGESGGRRVSGRTSWGPSGCGSALQKTWSYHNNRHRLTDI